MTTLSTESIASPTSQSLGPNAQCGRCQAPLAPDQRYCLECGERHLPRSDFLSAGPPVAGETPPARPPSAPPAPSTAAAGVQRSPTLTVLAGIGVLLLAMGVGVLIGRSGTSDKQGPAAPQVITVAPGPSAAGGAGAAPEASFTSDWPAGTSGYTVQLQTLPESGTTTSAVEAAKSAASAKGAKGVGALKSEEFTSLSAGSYVVYAGVDHTKAEAQKALGTLRKSFPAAKVIHLANGPSGSSSAASGSAGSAKGGAGSNESHPAPPSTLEGLKGAKGKSYEEKSKNLPNVVSTG